MCGIVGYIGTDNAKNIIIASIFTPLLESSANSANDDKPNKVIIFNIIIYPSHHF